MASSISSSNNLSSRSRMERNCRWPRARWLMIPEAIASIRLRPSLDMTLQTPTRRFYPFERWLSSRSRYCRPVSPQRRQGPIFLAAAMPHSILSEKFFRRGWRPLGQGIRHRPATWRDESSGLIPPPGPWPRSIPDHGRTTARQNQNIKAKSKHAQAKCVPGQTWNRFY